MSTTTDTYQATQNNANLTAPAPNAMGVHDPLEKDFENGMCDTHAGKPGNLSASSATMSSQGTTSSLNVCEPLGENEVVVCVAVGCIDIRGFRSVRSVRSSNVFWQHVVPAAGRESGADKVFFFFQAIIWTTTWTQTRR